MAIDVNDLAGRLEVVLDEVRVVLPEIADELGTEEFGQADREALLAEGTRALARVALIDARRGLN